MSLIDGETAPANVTAVVATTILSIDRHDCSALLEVPKINSMFLKMLCRRCRDAWAKIEDDAFDSTAWLGMSAKLKIQTETVLGTLTTQEEEIIRMRFGLGDGSEHTLEEVGRRFSIIRERIRQIEAKALCSLRHPSRNRELRAFLDHSR